MPHRIRDLDNCFDRLDMLMKVLREECPWDKEQTLGSLRSYTLEETFEVLEAVEHAERQGNWEALKNELGDLLLQVAFYARIADEQKAFDLIGVVDSLIEKMIYRHPHVFRDARPADLMHQWESLKDAEHGGRDSLMDGIPPLPALSLALKLQKRARRVGFDWVETVDVLAKMDEELEEFRSEVARADPDRDRVEDEFGDLLFTLVNLGRRLGLDAELALMRTNRKFKSRFKHMEEAAAQNKKTLDAYSLEQQEDLWLGAKAAEQDLIRRR